MEGSALERLIQAVLRRRVLNLVVEQSVLALTIALGAVVLLLIAGTQILNWAWPVLIFAAAAAWGYWRIRQRVPDGYRVAQSIDRELNFSDALSTAWHYRNTSIDVFDEEVKSLQRRRAEALAQQADPAVAAPYAVPPSARWCLLLGVAALGLFALRYGVQQSLDLSRPLVSFNLDPFLGGEARQSAKAKNLQAPPLEDFMKTISVQPPETKEEGLDAAPDSALGVVDIPDVNATNSEQPSAKTAEKGASSGEQQEGTESGEKGEGATGDTQQSPNEKGTESAGQPQKAPNDAKPSSPQSGENSSLLDKMRDALASMMNKLNIQQKQGEGQQQQQAKNQTQGQPSGNARQQQAQKGMQSKGQPSADQQQAANQGEGQEQDMQESDPSQAAQGKPGERNSAQAANQENKSGMGKQDGSKDVKLAEQMAAMGKISEIIGKRNEKLQGEIMIEVNSSKQALRTQYSNRAAQHTDSGGEIHRDEVPLALQGYVQQYFEEIRKTPPPRPAAKGLATPPVPAETP
jgi:hypothetical protein